MKYLLPAIVLALALTIGVAKADAITTVDVTAETISTVDTTSTGSAAPTDLAEAMVSVNLLAIASTPTDLAEAMVSVNLLSIASTSMDLAEAMVSVDVLAIASTSTGSVTPVIAAVPEPPSLALLASGVSMMLGLSLAWRRRGFITVGDVMTRGDRNQKFGTSS
jgi:hypothetical protein